MSTIKNPQNPFGLHSITPYMTINQGEQLIEFLQAVFNAELRGDIRYRADGSIQHAEIKIGDSVIMLNEPSIQFPNNMTTTFGLYVYVNDCDAVFAKALAEGGTEVLEIADYPHGDRYGGVKDFAGNIWWIVTHRSKDK